MRGFLLYKTFSIVRRRSFSSNEDFQSVQVFPRAQQVDRDRSCAPRPMAALGPLLPLSQFRILLSSLIRESAGRHFHLLWCA